MCQHTYFQLLVFIRGPPRISDLVGCRDACSTQVPIRLRRLNICQDWGDPQVMGVDIFASSHWPIPRLTQVPWFALAVAKDEQKDSGTGRLP